MNLSVSKNNVSVLNLDFMKEIEGIGSSKVTFLVGRSKDCHVVLDDMMVSREHAKLTYENRIWTIEKMGEFASVMINGSDLSSKELASGDHISIGPFSINVDIPIMEEPEPEEPEEEIVEETASTPEIPSSGLTMTETQVESSEEDDNLDTATDVAPEAEEEIGGDMELGGESDGDLDENAEISDDDGFTENEGEGGDGDEFGGGEEDEFAGGEEYAEDGEYSEEEYDGEDDDYAVEETGGGDGTQVIQTFAQVSLELFGEYAPYDKFVVEDAETFIGRDPEKCKIVLNDPEVSSVHAVIRKNNISTSIEDLQSGNGTILNGNRINKEDLSNGDEFIIGATTFTVVISSDFMENEHDRMMPVEENQVIEVEEVVEVEEDFGEDGEEIEEEEKSPLKRMWKDPKKRRMLIIAGLGLLAVLFLDDGSEEVNQKKKKKAPQTLVDKDKAKKAELSKKQKLKPEEQEFLDATYLLGKELLDQAKYAEAKMELEKILRIVPDYKNTKSLIAIAAQGLREIEELEKKRRAELERQARKKKVNDLLEKAKTAVKDRQKAVAEALFSKILELDPENFDVPQLKIELEAWVKEQERIAMEKAAKEAERKRKVGLAQPSKAFYLRKDWYNAIIKLEDFLKIKDMDEDLIKEATDMLKDAKKQLKNIVDPMLGKARSLKEGQDLKGAYEYYKEILKSDPVNTEALDEMNNIREVLTARSRKIYREAIVSESLSLFDDAKEKFQEVQQMSPTDSEYYKKATDKLKEYLD